MEDLRYIYPVARVRVLETRLLKKEIFLNMLDAESLDIALRILTETASYTLDVLNIRDSIGVGSFIARERKKLENLSQELFVESSLYEACINLTQDISRSYSLVAQTKSAFLKDFLKRFIDLYNIKVFLRLQYQKQSVDRLKAQLLDAGYIPKEGLINLFDRDWEGPYQNVIDEGIAQIKKDGNFAALERQIEDYLTDLLRPAKYMPFGPEAIFGYCLAKENELKRLHLILLAKLNKIPKNQIQERMS
jgi:V/A-type H+-transporting ATPase subunit C